MTQENENKVFSSARSRARWVPSLVAFLFFLSCTAFLFRDVLASVDTRVLWGQSVGGMHVWLYWWRAFALRSGLPLFETNYLMYPHGTPMPYVSFLHEWAAVLMQWVMSPSAAYNLLTLSNYVLTGYFSFVLFRKITPGVTAALAGALTHAFGQYMLIQNGYGQPTVGALYFNSLAVLTLLNYMQRPSFLGALAVGGCFLGGALTSPYIGFCFGAVFVGLAILYDIFWGGRRWMGMVPDKNVWMLLGALTGAVGISMGVYYGYLGHWGAWLGGGTRMYSHILAVVAPPTWHRSAWMQWLRPFKNSEVFVEGEVSFLGYTGVIFILWGCFRGYHKVSPAFRFWLWIFVGSAVLSLGPWLTISSHPWLKIPLPYLLVEKMPLAEVFRSVSRIWMTGSLALGAMVAIVWDRVFVSRSKWVVWLSFVVFVLLRVFEYDLLNIGNYYVSCAPTPLYEKLKSDPMPGALIELPQYYTPDTNDTPMVGYRYMLFQPFHKRPMVLGSTGRFLKESLNFTEHTPYVYELTHPWVLKELRESDRFLSRRIGLNREGAKILRKAGIGFVIVHRDVPYMPVVYAEEINRFLLESLGAPFFTDARGNTLYRVSSE